MSAGGAAAPHARPQFRLRARLVIALGIFAVGDDARLWNWILAVLIR